MATAMRYKTFIWPHNPRTFSLTLQRQTAVQKLPGGSFVTQDLGRTCRVMTGEGEFCGLGAYDTFKQLAAVFATEGPGILMHPQWLGASVYFTRLQLQQEPRADYVAYRFEFTEAGDTLHNMLTYQELTVSKPTSYIVSEGETIWSLGQRLGLDTAQLLQYNPALANPNDLKSGQVVKIG